jgi:hypothetical protein
MTLTLHHSCKNGRPSSPRWQVLWQLPRLSSHRQLQGSGTARFTEIRQMHTTNIVGFFGWRYWFLNLPALRFASELAFSSNPLTLRTKLNDLTHPHRTLKLSLQPPCRFFFLLLRKPLEKRLPNRSSMQAQLDLYRVLYSLRSISPSRSGIDFENTSINEFRLRWYRLRSRTISSRGCSEWVKASAWPSSLTVPRLHHFDVQRTHHTTNSFAPRSLVSFTSGNSAEITGFSRLNLKKLHDVMPRDSGYFEPRHQKMI